MDQERKMKRVADSVTEQSYILRPKSINSYGRLYGGQLLEWLDEIAGLVSRRHCEGAAVTAAIDHLEFRAGAVQGDIVYLRGYLTYVGNTSMEVRIDSYVEQLNGMRKLINRAFFVMVGVDENGRPVPVPGLILEGDIQQAEWELGRKRMEMRKLRAKEGY